MPHKEVPVPQQLYHLPFGTDENVRRYPAPFHRVMGNARWCVDFAMPEGTPIVAARGGIVVDRESRYSRNWRTPGPNGRPGNSIIIRHEDGQESFYAHLTWHSLCSPVGACVCTGQVLALSGQTGYATYPHLHFGVFDHTGRNIRIPWMQFPWIPLFLRIRPARL